MKKTVFLFLTPCICLTLSAALTACDVLPDEPEHTHTYTETVATEDYLHSAATCMHKAVYYKSCSCGEKGTETFEYGELGAHDFSTAWATGNGKHWHVCQNTGCQEISDENNHVYANGVCVCGDEEPAADIRIVSKTKWESAFNFENVTIKQYVVMEGQTISVGNYLLDGNDALFVMDNSQIPMKGYADFVRATLDFSDCYNLAEYQDGRYYISSFDVYGDESYVYENAYLTFENGILLSISATIKEEVTEYDDDDNAIGTTIETSVGYVEFVDYGTTDVTYENPLPLPITQAEWEETFAAENFDNMTIVASFSIGETLYTENVYYHNGKEKITVNGYSSVELYCLDSTWYTYNVNSATFKATDVFDDEYPFTTLSDSFKNFFSMMKNMYTLIRYDEEEDVYYLSSGDGGYYLTIEDGKVINLTTMLIIEGQTSVYSYTISNYGTTSFTVPFTLS